MNIVKAEILWSRKCLLKCSYCAMADNRDNRIVLEGWKKGFEQLKKLNCDFLAIYGAEPLEEFEKLPTVIGYAESIGIHTTVITSGITKELNYKLKQLYEHGLRSITTSYDMVSLDTSSSLKSSKALEVIKTFRSFGEIRDAAVVATLTKKNFHLLPETIEQMSSKGIWTFFDLIHFDRGQSGSKVRNTDVTFENVFQKDDFKALADVLSEVISMKKRGYLCHASEIFLNKIIDEHDKVYEWNCADEKCFPAWVTIDCDGTVYPCDDFQPTIFKYPNGTEKEISMIKMWNLYEEWDKFCNTWKKVIMGNCPGCCWNTHIDGIAIKQGLLPLSDYIHGLNK